MPMVYVRGSARARRVFHKTPDCRQAAKRTSSGDRVLPQEVDLRELRFPTPCKLCYPDTPRAVSFHRFCQLCNGARVAPCEHNGGVPVVIEMTRRSTTKLMTSVGDTYQRLIWVWPEKARHYVR